MNKRLLILSDPIGKPSYAPRLRYMCDYLHTHGFDIEVYTEKIQDYSFAHSYPIHEWSIYRGQVDWAIKSFWSLLTDWRNRNFSRRVRNATRGQSFDAVLVTTFSTFPLRAGLDIAKQRSIPLICDIRDLDEQVPNAQYQSHRGWWTYACRNLYKRVNIRRRNRVLRAADAITTISPWHVQFLQAFNKHVHLIYNGYDPKQFYFAPVQADSFQVSYIGRIYEFQHPEELFRILRQIDGVRLNLHTPDIQPIPTDMVGDEIRRSSVMIVLTDPAAKGMMTTKFYEALGCEKPIICYPSDHGLLADTIAKTNAGIATDNVDDIRTFIASKYAEWQQNGYTRQAVKNKEMFSRELHAKQMEKVLNSMIEHD